MRILGCDTSTLRASIALVDGESVAFQAARRGPTHAEALLPMLDELLKKNRARLEDVDGFVIGLGPGSFTGLRIGLATFKGLAAAMGKPLVGVSSLAALAFGIAKSENTPRVVLACLDAKRGEVYFSGYQFPVGRGGTVPFVPIVREQVGKPEKFCEVVASYLPVVVVGEGAILYRSLLEEKIGKCLQWAPEGMHTPDAVTIAGLARDPLAMGEGQDYSRLVPNYVRPSDAHVSA